jgi:DNA-binding MarR family transcriptional regulator
MNRIGSLLLKDQQGSHVMDDGRVDILDTACACAALRMAARAASQFYDLVLQPSGLKATQFFALKSIEEAGEIAQWKFSRDNAVAVETLSRRFSALRKRGLVTARIGGNHGERIYSLTESGKAALRGATPYWERAQKRLRQTLGDSDLRELLRVCGTAVQAAQKAERLRAINSVSHRDGGSEFQPPNPNAIAS